MPPKKKNQDADDLGAMRAARFGRVKNTLSMGFGTIMCRVGINVVVVVIAVVVAVAYIFSFFFVFVQLVFPTLESPHLPIFSVVPITLKLPTM